ncbi:MAG: hypothetical protein ACK5DJ_06205 [Bacteroidota bacterium]
MRSIFYFGGLLPGVPLVGGIKSQPNAGTSCLSFFICLISLKQAWLMPF